MTKIFSKRVFSGALQFAIYTAAVVALLLFGLILYLHSFSVFGQQTVINNSNIKALQYGFVAVLKENSITNDTVVVINPEDSFQQIKTNSEYWGIFQKTKVQTVNRTKKFEKIALIGSHFLAQDRTAIYVKDLLKPLVVVGKTKIEGNVFLSEQGIRPGNIVGNSYYGEQLIYNGTISKSTEKLPELNTTLLKTLDFFLNEAKPFSNDDYLEINLKNVNSFFNSTKWIYDNKPITISEEYIGNIIIKSDTLIRVTSQSKLKDVVLIAPNVIIEDNVSGIFQVIASTNIKVGKNVVLDYPSSLVLKKDKMDNTIENRLYIDERTTIKGIVCYFTKNDINNFSIALSCAENTLILGEVYCDGNFELKGGVIGSVYTHQFSTNTGGTIFVNHLYNASISSVNLPEYYSGLLFENQSKNISKWLY